MTLLPPLHSPYDRALIGRCDAWEIRRYDEHDPRFGYFAARGQLHIQLWHPGDRISIVTPCALTGDRFELARNAFRASIARWPSVVAALPGYTLPQSAELASLIAWLIVRHEVAAIRGPVARRGDA
jgi:hypothetical protein